jgi:hypothetical protein
MDPRYKLLIYCTNKNGCKCFHELVKDKFNVSLIPDKHTFHKCIKESDSNAAVVCLTSTEKKFEEFI